VSIRHRPTSKCCPCIGAVEIVQVVAHIDFDRGSADEGEAVEVVTPARCGGVNRQLNIKVLELVSVARNGVKFLALGKYNNRAAETEA